MTEATDSVRLVAEASRRHAIVEAWVAAALLAMTGILADQQQAWHAAGSGIAAGGFLCAAGFTAVRALTWRREADKRDEAACTLSHPWPSPTAEKGIAK